MKIKAAFVIFPTIFGQSARPTIGTDKFWGSIGPASTLSTVSATTVTTVTATTVSASADTLGDFSELEIDQDIVGGNRPGNDDFNATDDDIEILPG